MKAIDLSALWNDLQTLAQSLKEKEPALTTLLNETILERSSFSECLIYRITRKLVNQTNSINVLKDAFENAFEKDPDILKSIAHDMIAVKERDPACPDILNPLLYFKGFQAIL